MSQLSRRPALRWVAPGAAFLLVAGAGFIAAKLPADASVPLPARSAAQLLSDVSTVRPTGLSGTVQVSMHLGLPDLPSSLTGRSGSALPLTMLSGDHTLKVWAAKNGGGRVALLGDASETDLVVGKTGVWLWQSADQTATHYALPKAAADGHTGNEALPHDLLKRAGGEAGGAAALSRLGTPSGAADWFLKQIDPTTAVSTAANVRVAGRSAYELIATPRTTNTKIGSVRVAIDSATKVPLRVTVYARGSASPAISVGFTSVSFAEPSADTFTFTAPKDAKVVEGMAPSAKTDKSQPSSKTGGKDATGKASDVKVVGAGWSSVLVTKLPTGTSTNAATGKSGANSLQGLLQMLPSASGSWGSGHVLDASLFTAVVTDDGRLAVGAVPAQTVYSALGH